MARKFAALALAAFVVGYLAWPSGGETRRVVALDEGNVAGSLREAGSVSSRAGVAAAALAAPFGKIDPDRGALVFSLGAASVALPLADDSHEFVSVQEGLRREEVAGVFAKKLGWTEDERREFAGATSTCSYRGGEGYRFPGAYLVAEDATPEEVVAAMEDRFAAEYGQIVASGTPAFDPDTVVRIASLIQREAAGKADMRLISGIIWNRIVLGMPLQVDATLQYVKGKEGRWWPRVASKDKHLDSPYNTYQIDGLPPEAIASPGEAALEAAMYPADTSCIFYLHDRSRTIHCSSDYKGHLQNIKRYL